ncbi:MAG: metallophosphoesterase family protein [Muribaculaceae bacterium]|nr:metallophosphoesterase family protein [Muribaculaceae bacterium]MEE1365146.1 metallophosphoesterase family protein [Muribaculaceae bacterium]
MKRIGLLSDTHSCIDARYAEYFADCDEIWHAGDVGDMSVIVALEQIAPLRAVSGNIDHGEVKRHCREVEIFETEGVKVLMTHIGGYPGKYSPGMKRLLKEQGVRLFISGHSHILKVIYDPELQLLHINPGAAGKQGWQQKRTLVRFTIDTGDIKDLEVIEFGAKSCQDDACK